MEDKIVVLNEEKPKKKKKVKYSGALKTKGEKAFDIINIFIMLLLSAVYIIPILFIVFSSFTSSQDLKVHGYSLIIRSFSFEYYQAIFGMSSNQFLLSMANSVLIVVATTAIMVVTTSLSAFVLSRSKLKFKKTITFIFIIPMLFAGGTIPFYLVIHDLGLLNTYWAIILPSGVSAWYVLLCKNFFASIPESLYEAAEIDGAGNMKVLWKITFPLGFPIIATIILYTSVAIWNDWFQASLFFDSAHESMIPVQTFVKKLDTDVNVQALFGSDFSLSYDGLRSAAVILSLLPIVLVYPLIQRFFIQGSMAGSVKE